MAAPCELPDTTPVSASTEAIEVLLLLHIPPVAELLKPIVVPAQTGVVPLIDPGTPLTVIDFTAIPHELE
jgi:hypothetical protein